MSSNCWIKAILSDRSSRILTNWPDLTLSTSFRGNGSAAGEKMSPVYCYSVVEEKVVHWLSTGTHVRMLLVSGSDDA